MFDHCKLCKYISECTHIIHLFIFRVIKRVNPEIDEIADYTIILQSLLTNWHIFGKQNSIFIT